MATRPDDITILSLCTGGAGLELGLDLALGCTRTICCVEREAYADALLVQRMQEQALADAPVWSDLQTFDGKPWRGCVDLVCAGYPCQPFSFAGKRGGEDDDRHLWPEVARIVGEVQPSLCFFENVSGHLTLGFDAVADDLERLGYRLAVGLFTASEVGASHKRERLFILADRESERCGEARKCIGDEVPGTCQRGTAMDHANSEQPNAGEQRDWSKSNHAKHELADSGDERPQGDGEAGPEAGAVGRGGGAGVEYTDSTQREPQCLGQVREQQRPSAGRTDIPLFPPGPAEHYRWRRVLEADPALEPALCGMADGVAHRVDRLRLTGNGVVPLQAAYAFTTLWACLHH